MESCAVPGPSAVSMCRKNDSVAEGTPGGIATSWYSVSVWVVPWPPSQASHAPWSATSQNNVAATNWHQRVSVALNNQD